MVRHRIIAQAADLSVLLRYVSGEYRPSHPTPVVDARFRRILYGALAVLIAAVVVAIVVLTKNGTLAW